MTMRTGLVAAALVLVMAGASSQISAQTAARPDFSGTWVQLAPGDGAGDEIVVTHTAALLTQRHAAEGPDHVLRFYLDGATHPDDALNEGSGHEMKGTHKATWDGARLVIDQITDYQSGFHRVAKSVWWLDDKGQLVVKVDSNLPDGSRLDVTVVYRKK
jgi:hypothetical protein